MKKLFTLLVAAGTISFASAQGIGQKGRPFTDNKYESREREDFGKSKPGATESYSFSAKEKEMQIQRINREFDERILMVKGSRHLRAREKSKRVRMLEIERIEQIRAVQLRFENNKGRGYDRGNERNDKRKW